jgi:hypothetical protein
MAITGVVMLITVSRYPVFGKKVIIHSAVSVALQERNGISTVDLVRNFSRLDIGDFVCILVMDAAVRVQAEDNAAGVIYGTRVLHLQALVLLTYFVQVVLTRHVAYT